MRDPQVLAMLGIVNPHLIRLFLEDNKFLLSARFSSPINLKFTIIHAAEILAMEANEVENTCLVFGVITSFADLDNFEFFPGSRLLTLKRHGYTRIVSF